jgi:F0F1-type ATP synthase assembly protein I
MDEDRQGHSGRPDPRARRGNQQPGFLAFSGLGLLNALCLAAGLISGVFIDRALGTRPLFIFLGLIAGIAMGVLITRAEWKRYF